MKKTNYKDKPKQDLIKVLMEKREASRKLRFATTGSKNRNVKEAGTIKKDIARIMTELNSSTRLTTSK